MPSECRTLAVPSISSVPSDAHRWPPWQLVTAALCESSHDVARDDASDRDDLAPPPGDEYEEIREQVSFREVYDLIDFIPRSDLTSRMRTCRPIPQSHWAS